MLAAVKRTVHPASAPSPAPGRPPPTANSPSAHPNHKHTSKRTDSIDALDRSSSSAPMHHDSPYDALAPHRNRANAAAPPVRAFSLARNDGADSVHTLASSSGIPTPGESPAAPTAAPGKTNNTAPHGISHVPGSTAFARASAAQRHKAYSKPSNDLWGVNPEPWQDFATPEGDQYPAHHPVYGAHVGSATASATSSEWDMEAILRGGQRASPTASGLVSPDAPDDGPVASASPLPERDWSRVGTSKRAMSNDKHKTRRFTFQTGKRGARPVSPSAEPTQAPAGQLASAPLVHTKSVPLVSQREAPPPILRVQGRSQSVSTSAPTGAASGAPAGTPAGVTRRTSVWAKLAKLAK